MPSNSSNAKDADSHIDCFNPDAEMIDVARTFNGNGAIRTRALREVIPQGGKFAHWKILETGEGYAKSDVNRPGRAVQLPLVERGREDNPHVTPICGD